MFSRGQSTIENMIILAVAIFILIAFLSTAWEQITMQHNAQQVKVGSLALQTLTKEINDVYFLGPGSKKEVLVILPDLIDSNYSSIENSTLSLRVAGTDLFSTTKVPVRGTWPNSSGSYVFTIEAFNDFVSISTNLLSFSPTQMNKVLIQDSSAQYSLFITNSKSESASYDFSIIFSSSVASISSSDEGNLEFTAGEQKEITIDFYCSNSSAGNYSALLFFEGDANVTFPVNLTCLSGQTKLTIFPNSKTINTIKDIPTSERFLVCNNSSNNFSSASVVIDGNLRQQSITNFSSAILANTCEPLDLNIFSNDDGNYYGTISVSASGYTATSSISLMISQALSSSNYYFASVDNNSLHHWFDFNGFVNKRSNDLNYWVASGELDWNMSKDFSVNGVDWDQNLIAYYKFNDLNADGYVIDSARGNDGSLVGGATISDGGMWDSNALLLDEDNEYVSFGDIGLINYATELSACVWVFSSTDTTDDVILAKNSGTSNGFDLYRDDVASSSGRTDVYRIVIRDSEGTGFARIESDSSLGLAGKWNHVCFAYKANTAGTGLRLFVNGKEDSHSPVSTSGITGINTSGHSFNVGALSDGSVFFDGKIDEVKIWDKQITFQEVVIDYNKFLEAKFVDKNIIDAGLVVDWNSILINKNVVFDENRMKSQIDINFFACSDLTCATIIGNEYLIDVNNDIWRSFSSLPNSQYLFYHVFFKPRNEYLDYNAGTFWTGAFLQDVNISYSS